jgi:hypothetical protein
MAASPVIVSTCRHSLANFRIRTPAQLPIPRQKQWRQPSHVDTAADSAAITLLAHQPFIAPIVLDILDPAVTSVQTNAVNLHCDDRGTPAARNEVRNAIR